MVWFSPFFFFHGVIDYKSVDIYLLFVVDWTGIMVCFFSPPPHPHLSIHIFPQGLLSFVDFFFHT